MSAFISGGQIQINQIYVNQYVSAVETNKTK